MPRRDIYTACEQVWKKPIIEQDFIRPEAEAFAGSPVDSIDYAVMEHTDTAAVLVGKRSQFQDVKKIVAE